MRSTAAQILETALALQRAPGERFRLRERPLPTGVIHLIEVAAGSPQALHAAAAELGEPEPALIEAARFYLEQVLFADPAADAYRVLGLAPTASQEAVRTHHRWLQRWLHPDRSLAGDASVFATRVNQAFAQLRSPESRHAYDVRIEEARLAGASAPLPPETVRHWERAEEMPRYGRRSRWLLAAALASCVVLAVLIARNSENAAPWQPDNDAAMADAPEAPRRPEIGDHGLRALSEALSTVPVQAPPAATPPAATELVRLEPSIDPASRMQVLSAAGSALPARDASLAMRQIPVSPRQAPRPVNRAALDPLPAPAQIVAAAVPASAVVAGPTDSLHASAVATSAAAPSPVAPDPEVVLKRMRLAEQRVDQVVGYLGARPGAFPIWNDPGVEAQAARLRGQLNARSGSLELTRPAWRMRPDSASLDAGYRCRPATGGSCEGRFVVDLVWREGLWLVRDVSLAPLAPSA